MRLALILTLFIPETSPLWVRNELGEHSLGPHHTRARMLRTRRFLAASWNDLHLELGSHLHPDSKDFNIEDYDSINIPYNQVLEH